MKKSKELQIQFSQNIETSNQASIVQGPGNFHQFPEVSELCISVDRGKKTLNGGRFLLKNDRENGIVIFSTNEDLKILASCENILGDGTFSKCENISSGTSTL